MRSRARSARWSTGGGRAAGFPLAASRSVLRTSALARMLALTAAAVTVAAVAVFALAIVAIAQLV